MASTIRMALVATTLLCSACDDDKVQANSDAQSASPPAESVFRTALNDAPENLDPLKASSAYSSRILLNVYDTLYRYRLFTPAPELRSSVALDLPEVSADGKTATIRLRADVEFAEHPAFGGQVRKLTAHDVVYSLKRHLVPKNLSDGAWLWQDELQGVAEWRQAGADLSAPLAGLQALDDYTLQLRLNRPNPLLAYSLASPYSAIVAKEVAESSGLAQTALGSGPFVLSKFDATAAVLSRNPNFRKETIDLNAEGYDAVRDADTGYAALAGKALPLIDRIELSFMREDASRMLAAEQNQTDNVQLSAAMAQSIMQDKGLNERWAKSFHLGFDQELGAAFTQFNLLNPSVGDRGTAAQRAKNKALRCAIVSAFDWNERAQKINSGFADVFTGVVPPGTLGFDPANLRNGASFERAQQLLQSGGWSSTNLPALEFATSGGLEQQQIFELFRAQMMRVGFPQTQLRYKSFPSFGAFVDAMNRSELMLMDQGWQLDVPDGENILQLYYGPYQAPQLNTANYVNPAFDKAFDELRITHDQNKRSALIQAMNQMLIDDCVVLSGISRRFAIITRTNFIYLPRAGLRSAVALRFVAPR